jgi:hypothetical protein
VASLFDLDAEAVPHFLESGDEVAAFASLCNWIKGRGYHPWFIRYDRNLDDGELRQIIAENNPSGHYLLFSADHVVVCYGGMIVHNPAWWRTALERPTDYWTIMIVGAL